MRHFFVLFVFKKNILIVVSCLCCNVGTRGKSGCEFHCHFSTFFYIKKRKLKHNIVEKTKRTLKSYTKYKPTHQGTILF